MRVLSYNNATIALSFFNLVATFFFLLCGHASLYNRYLSASSRRLSSGFQSWYNGYVTDKCFERT
ncbi:hypothetical protein FCM35_KLT10140 [Carex littledalei]|uniref:Uncharacterized protein n=1 Tax=Carex littledalei TaxID=544730 RepID=A0A833RLJ9_9POAL|nr:hypothetical protein FCM35_KLT10140 [Carex littledalei]